MWELLFSPLASFANFDRPTLTSLISLPTQIRVVILQRKLLLNKTRLLGRLEKIFFQALELSIDEIVVQ